MNTTATVVALQKNQCFSLFLVLLYSLFTVFLLPLFLGHHSLIPLSISFPSILHVLLLLLINLSLSLSLSYILFSLSLIFLSLIVHSLSSFLQLPYSPLSFLPTISLPLVLLHEQHPTLPFSFFF